MLLYALAIQAAGLGLYLVVPKPGVKAAGDLAGAALVVVVLAKFGFEPGGALNPILSSPWFAVHILLAFAGYGLLTVGLVWTIVSMFDPGVRQPAGVPFRLASAVVVTLGAGILTGAMWADESWGTFWNWDPKESWALLAWTVMVTYVHVAGREPRRWLSALFYVGAFAVMAFTFVGINLLKWGAHRY
jgi:ABC-type transport system involved in cytochrome c biogenesis permease subunit